jgi:hypothetical protein
MARTQQILFIQGGGAGAHDEWDDKLVDSLRRELGGTRPPRRCMPTSMAARSHRRRCTGCPGAITS